MKKLYSILLFAFLLILLTSCAASRERFSFIPSINDRLSAVVDITEISRSTTEIPDDTAVTEPKYFEVVATSTTAPVIVEKPPVVTEEPKEYYTVKFVDIDGYSALSVQSVEEGKSALEPPMPNRRGDMIFIGWNKDFTNIKSSMIVKAVYQKEWLTVRFFDFDSTLLKTESIYNGEDAKPPEISVPDGYIFDGWSKPYKNITEDVDIYARYSPIPKRTYTKLTDAYGFLPIVENSIGIPKSAYYRKEHVGICTIKGEDYGGNIVYGNFCDEIDISGYGFTSFEGMLGLKAQPNNINNTEYALVLKIYLDDVLKFSTEINSPDTSQSFALDLKNVSKIKIFLEPYVNGLLYYKNAEFIGGLIDTVLYEN